ncbi:MAG: transglycosylase domain-containing protein [Bacteroidetes bacterium]|nr:transglycosylase domain-containing protein [Bacteroidota bacterium]
MSRPIQILWRVFFILTGLGFLIIALANWGVFGEMPSLDELENPSASLSSEVLASDGTLMGKYYLQDRSNIEFKDLAQNSIHALVATEDERFYEHSGIDGIAVARAIVNLGNEGGGSTLTQQLAKNLFTNYSGFAPLRVLQKIKEWIIAVKLERNFTKDEIIALYFNTVPFGDNVYGIRNAARTFFQKEPALLTVNESAVLVGMLKGNTIYNPRRDPRRSQQRRNVVLDQMVKNKYLTKEEAAVIKVQPIPLNYKKLEENDGIAPYFREVLRDELKKWCKENKKANDKPYNIYRDGLKIYTTLNPKMQLYAEAAVDRHLKEMQRYYHSLSYIKDGSIWKGREAVIEQAIKSSDRWRNMKAEGYEEDAIRASFKEKTPMKVFAWNDAKEKDTVMTPLDSIKYHKTIIQTGFMVMDPFTGEVKAWVGGIHHKRFKFDHVNLQTKRQVGSTFKPILYAYAVENGYTPETPLPGGPIRLGDKIIDGSGGPMAYCLAYSKNPGAVHLINQFGVKSVINFAKEAGIQSEIPPFPSIALGSADLSLFEMMHSYTMFPTNGISSQPIYITKIEDRNGNVIYTNLPKQKVVMSEAAAYTMCKMMQGVVDFGTGRRLRGMGLTMKMAGKTGTTNSNTDTWFMGYTPQLMGGAWVGCDDPFLKMTGEGSRMALPIWGYFFSKAYSDNTLGLQTDADFIQPASMKVESIMDYENFAEKYKNEPDAENEDAGSGNADDFLLNEDAELIPDDPNTQAPTKEQETENKIINEAINDKKSKSTKQQ